MACFFQESYNNEEDSEDENIKCVLLCPLSTPHIGNHSLPTSILHLCKNFHSLFYCIITPPPRDFHHDHVLLKVGQITNLPPNWKKVHLRMSSYGSTRTWKTESVELFVVSVSLHRLASVEKVFSK